MYVSIIDQVQVNQNSVFLSKKCGRRLVEALRPAGRTDERLPSISEKITFIKITTRSTAVFQ